MTRPGLPTRGHHVFVAPFGDADRVVVDGDEGHHLAGVLRVRAGQPLSLADNTGAVFAAEVEAVSANLESSIEAVASPSDPKLNAQLNTLVAEASDSVESVQVSANRR